MKNKKTLKNGISVLIVTVLAIAAFTREYVTLGLTTVFLIGWSIWAFCKFVVPYISEKMDAYEARQLREMYEAEEKAKIENPADATAGTLLLHVNHRISAYLKSAYPDATWDWCVEDPEALVAKGGTGRIKVFGVADFNQADVTINQNAGISCEMLKVVPMSEIGADETGEGEPKTVKPANQNPIDPRVWYESNARVVLENLISDLHSRGHSSLSITENGEVLITQENKETRQAMLENMPDKAYWARLSKVFQSEGLAANVTDNKMVLSWS